MNPTDFNKPDKHPFTMMQGYRNAAEKESVLSWILIQHIEAGDWSPVKTEYEYDALVADGFLEWHGYHLYTLTTKAKGFLYAFFGKD